MRCKSVEKDIYSNRCKWLFRNNVVRRLLQEEQNEVRALVLPDDELNSLNGLNCKIYYGDVTNKETLKEIFTINEKAEVYVIHCAAIVSIKSKHDSKMYESKFWWNEKHYR